nr:transporter substrate-binding domain-containing protein [Pseudemcibacter aquimaris]
MLFISSLSTHAQDTPLSLTQEERNWLRDNPEILVATDPTMQPMEFIGPNGEISGIAGDYLKLMGERLGVQFKWAGNNNWAEGLEKIHAGEAHMVSGANNTPDRREFLSFTDSYFKVSIVIFSRIDRESFGNMDALSGRTISQVKGFSLSRLIRQEYPEINIIEAETTVEALQMVADGDVDAYVGNISVAAYYISEAGLHELVVVGGAPYSGANAMAARKDLPLLASSLQKAMSSITPIEKAEISRKWLSLNYNITDGWDYVVRWGPFVLIIILAILYRNYSLQQEIRMRKAAQSELALSREKETIARLDAEKANNAKSNFLANMSHELRTPLNAIIGFSETMSGGVYGEIKEPKYIEYLSDIRDSGKHLEKVIDDILDLSKIEAGKWELNNTEFSLTECAETAIMMLEIQAESKGITLKLENLTDEDDVRINGDKNTYKRVLINLLSNAVKFTNKDGLIICRIEKTPSGQVMLSVIDDGVGIKKEDIETVLTPFGQVHDINQKNKAGTGLGLPIVKQIVELHGHTFDLKSDFGKGTTASVIIG